MPPKRIKGNKLIFKAGTPAIDYKCDLTAITLENEEADSDVVTFCDAAEGGARQFFLNFGMVQSTDVTSFWRYAWDHPGQEVAFTYAPHGNETPTPDEPHFIGTATIGPRPTLGGEAGATNVFTAEQRWDVVGVPTLDDGTSGGE